MLKVTHWRCLNRALLVVNYVILVEVARIAVPPFETNDERR